MSALTESLPNAPVAPRLALVAGEASGDLLGSLLLQSVRERWPKAQSYGIGGPAMQAQGFAPWWPSDLLAVRGYVEVLRRYPQLLRVRRELGNRLLGTPKSLNAQRPEVFIGVDAPDFNLGLERRLKAAGVKTVHYISPSIWAWRGERIETIAQSCDHVLCIFPFEPALYHARGIAATFVGHPLANVIPQDYSVPEAKTQLGLDPARLVLALLPGSRSAEVEHLLPRMAQALKLLQAQRPELQCVLPAVPSLKPRIEALLHAAGVQTAGIQTAGVQSLCTVLQGQSYPALAAADVVLVASGTATLEAALFGKPMVITYAMHPLSLWLHERKRYQPWVGLPNILLEDFVVPERIQNAATPSQLAQDVGGWLDDTAHYQATAAKLRGLHGMLRADTAGLIQGVLTEFLG